MANAKAKGKQIGRKPITKEDLPSSFLKYYPLYINGTMSITELSRVCGLSRPTIYKYLKMAK
jgi:DNA invertase Pin-like site-specific DNA recombinase